MRRPDGTRRADEHENMLLGRARHCNRWLGGVCRHRPYASMGPLPHVTPKLFRAQWEELGQILVTMFPQGRPPVSAEVLGALVFELTHGAASQFTRRPGVDALVSAMLTALYLAHGKR